MKANWLLMAPQYHAIMGVLVILVIIMLILIYRQVRRIAPLVGAIYWLLNPKEVIRVKRRTGEVPCSGTAKSTATSVVSSSKQKTA